MDANSLILERVHGVKGLDPVADAFSATVASKVVNLSLWRRVLFVIVKGAGAIGTSTVTVEACSNTVPTATSAIPFKYKAMTSGDTEGTLTEATAAGFVTTAGSSQRYYIELDSAELLASGYKYARLKMVEVVDDPVLGGIEILCFDPVYAQKQHASVIV